ncbi:MAG: hypothetical protein NTW72_05300, partial [Gemmatimonadetes bacterium]|nr:hypothetical protein [Gemmatimonadota bacterium]
MLDALRLAGVPRIHAYVDGSRGPADDAGHAAVLALPAGVVIEEDIRLAPGAYGWMCEALDRYGDDRSVGAVSGWAHRRFIPADADRGWWSARWSCWGWASWRRTWHLVKEPVDVLLERLAREGFDAAGNGEDVMSLARAGHWDAHLGLALYGARMLTLYPPRSLSDHIGVGGAATNQHGAGQWRAVPAAPLTDFWAWPDMVAEHPGSAALWRKAAVADQFPTFRRTLAGRLRRRLAVLWHRLARAWRQWPEALALRLTLTLYRARHGHPFDDDSSGATTPIRRIWNDFLLTHRDAFFGSGLEIGDARMTTALGGAQMQRCEVVDILARSGVDYVVDLQCGWDLPEGKFDVFLNQFTLHVVADDRAMLWHSLRALRTEGTLLANFPCAGPASYDGLRYGHEQTVVWRWYTLPGVRALLAELGIDDAHQFIILLFHI